MDTDELKHFGLRLAAVSDRLDERSAAAVRQVEQSSFALEQGARQLQSGADVFVRTALQELEAQAGKAIERGTRHAIERCNAQLQETVQVAAATARNLQQAQLTLQRERRTWIWLGSGALLAGSILSIAGVGFAVKASSEQIARNKVEAALLHAYNQADVTLCGDRLCANFEETGPRYGHHKQYRTIKPRQQLEAADSSQARR
jgi:hypothetical protein